MSNRPHEAAGHNDATAYRYRATAPEFGERDPASASLPNDGSRPMTAEDEIDALLADLPLKFPGDDDPLADAVLVHVDPAGHAKRVEISNIFTASGPRKPLERPHRRVSSLSARNQTSVHRDTTPKASEDDSITLTPIRKRRSRDPIDPFALKPSLPGLRRRSAPVTYEKMRAAEKFALLCYAIAAKGPVMALTVNLTPERERHYRDRRTASKLLADMTRHLKKVFGREIHLVLHIEESDNGRLHLHGLVGISESDAVPARAAIRKAVGEWEEHRQFQAHTSADPDAYWPSYCMKNRNDPRRTLDGESLAGRFREIDTNGKPYAASNYVRCKAKDIYNGWRDRFNADRKTNGKERRLVTNSKPENILASVSHPLLAENLAISQK